MRVIENPKAVRREAVTSPQTFSKSSNQSGGIMLTHASMDHGYDLNEEANVNVRPHKD